MTCHRQKAFLLLVPNDPYFFAIFSKIVFSWSKQYPNHLILVSPIWAIEFDDYIQPNSLISVLKFFKRRFSYLASQVMLHSKVYRGICFNNAHSLPVNVRVIGLLEYIRSSGFQSVHYEELERLRGLKEEFAIFNVNIGDLLIDTYLRFKPSPSVNFTDSFFGCLLKKSKKMYNYFEYIFRRYDIQCLFGSYTTYIYHGLPLRFAQSLGIKIFTLGGNIFYQYHDQNSNLSHLCDHSKYSPFIPVSKDFEKLAVLARESLENRLHARPDASTSYMQHFSTSTTLHESIDNKHIIFLHDFFDSPHCYRWMLHHDFYHWITDTIDSLLRSRIKLYIKPHPNQCLESKYVVSSLMQKYSHDSYVNWISEKVSNSTILKRNPLLIISVYGSVLVEAAFCGVRSISAGDHPAYNFNVAYNPHDLKDYHQKLQNPSLIRLPNPQDAILFLAQQNETHSVTNIPSLLNYLGCHFDQLYVDQELLHSPSVNSFIQSSVNHVLDAFPF